LKLRNEKRREDVVVVFSAHLVGVSLWFFLF